MRSAQSKGDADSRIARTVCSLFVIGVLLSYFFLISILTVSILTAFTDGYT